MKRLAVLTSLVLATITAVYLLWAFRSIVELLVLALVLAAILRSPMEALKRRGVPQGMAMTLVLLAGGALLLGFLAVVGYLVVERLPPLFQDFSANYNTLKAQWAQGTAFEQAFAQRLPPADQVMLLLASDQETNYWTLALGVTESIGNMLTNGALVIILSIYWLADIHYFEGILLSLLASKPRAQMRTLWRTLEASIGAYLRSEITQSVLAALLLYGGFWLMGIRYPLLLAFFVAIAWFVPVVGVLLGLLPTVLIGLLSSPLLAGLAVAYMLAILALMEFVVEPHFYQRRAAGALLSVLVILAMVDALGMVGLLVAPPLALAIQIILAEWWQPTPALAVTSTAGMDGATTALDLAQLHQRLADVRTALGTLPVATPPQTANLYQRLAQLVEAVEQTNEAAVNP